MTSKTHIQTSIEQSLHTLAQQELEPFDCEMAIVLSQHIGDGIRLGAEIPLSLRSWLRKRPAQDLSVLCERSRQRVANQVLPSDDLDISELEQAANTRDLAESMQTAVLHACVSSGQAPAEFIETWNAMRIAFTEFDTVLATIADRDMVERALGERRWLLGDHPWTRVLSPSEDKVEGESGEGLDDLDVLDSELSAPPDHVVADYVENGRYDRWVEGTAARLPEFSATLSAVIDAFREMGESVCFMARRWQQRQGQASSGETSTVVELPLAFAKAASSDTRVESRVERLGRLAPLSAVAILSSSPGEIELHVLPGDEELQEVALGRSVVSQPAASGAWEVRLPFQSEPVEIRVVAKSGTCFVGMVQAVLPVGE